MPILVKSFVKLFSIRIYSINSILYLLVIDIAVGKYGQVVDKLAEIMSSNSLVLNGKEANSGLNIENECSVNRQDDSQVITTPFWIQFKCLFKRSVLCSLRDLVYHLNYLWF